jgi:hypothetical protein
MPIIHIDVIQPGDDENEYKTKKSQNLKILNDHLNKGNHVFALIHMTGCGPCQATKPKWLGLKSSKLKDSPDVCVVDIEHTLLDGVKHEKFKSNIQGFPTMRHIKGQQLENYEDVSGIKKDRSLESFIQWLEMKLGKGQSTDQSVHSRRHHHHHHHHHHHNRHTKRPDSMRGGTRKKKRQGGKYPMHGGKWSRKYKNSINCARPKGFSQRQHCKYGRHKKKGGDFSVNLSFDIKTGKRKSKK